MFGGDIAGFLKAGEVVFGDIYDLLDQQFHRLSELEQELMYWLAIEREAISLEDLKKDLVYYISKRKLIEALDSLRLRYMIEISGTAHFTLQPVIMEYVTAQFIERVSEEINTETVNLFASHAL